ncbi:hypothetical protein FRB91_000025 [Serendipita sp. 411]|nr:hypothetical protein FRB91_000025 [Serendipita sp. 411]
MPPSLITEPPPDGPRSRAKDVVHVLFHLWHLLIVFLLFVVIFGGLALGPMWDPRYSFNLSTLYLLPLAIYDLVFTFIQLFKIDGSRFLPRPLNFGIFARIRFRAYLYQSAAALAVSLSQMGQANPVQGFSAFVIWVFGLCMLILGCIASRFGFLDWIQEVQRDEQEEQQRIRLPISSEDEGDEEDIFEGTLRRRRRRERPRRAKTLVRNAIHVWDLLIILFLIPIALVSIVPTRRQYDFFLFIYLIPMMIFSVAYSLVWFCKQKKDRETRRTSGKIVKTFLTRFQFGFFSRIRVRGFIYQAFAIIPLSDPLSPEASFARYVWVSGVAMFVLGCVANECGFLDWLQEKEGEEESIVQVFASSDEENDEEGNVDGHENTAQATR